MTLIQCHAPNVDERRVVAIWGEIVGICGGAVVAAILVVFTIRPEFGIIAATLASIVYVFASGVVHVFVGTVRHKSHPEVVRGSIFILTATVAAYFWRFLFGLVIPAQG